MFERVGDVINAAITQANIGEVLINQGRYDLAAPSIEQACRTHRAIGFVEGLIFDEIQNGRLARARGERDLAAQTLRAARDEAMRLRMHTTALEAAIYLAGVLTDEGETGEALAVLEAAEEAAGADAAMLAPSAALARAEALAAAVELADADTVATAGIDAARTMGDGYKRGQLLLVRAAAREKLGLQSWADDREEGLALLQPMEVAADLRLAATSQVSDANGDRRARRSETPLS
jgi:tetratricopeptide (TPR) repeat protein